MPVRNLRTWFWTFSQNNSGGSFVEDKQVSHHVVIEATDKDSAESRAENVGIYFNGVDEGQDCPCCGDRWHRPYQDKGMEEPEVYGVPAAEHVDMFCESPVRIHYLDGRVESVGKLGTYAESKAVSEKYQALREAAKKKGAKP